MRGGSSNLGVVEDDAFTVRFATSSHQDPLTAGRRHVGHSIGSRSVLIQFAWQNVCSFLLALPALRGRWCRRCPRICPRASLGRSSEQIRSPPPLLPPPSPPCLPPPQLHFPRPRPLPHPLLLLLPMFKRHRPLRSPLQEVSQDPTRKKVEPPPSAPTSFPILNTSSPRSCYAIR